jgi:hypothetical protein
MASYSCSKTNTAAAVAARMSQVILGYLINKLHTFQRISVEAGYKLQGESDRNSKLS